MTLHDAKTQGMQSLVTELVEESLNGVLGTAEAIVFNTDTENPQVWMVVTNEHNCAKTNVLTEAGLQEVYDFLVDQSKPEPAYSAFTLIGKLPVKSYSVEEIVALIEGSVEGATMTSVDLAKMCVGFSKDAHSNFMVKAKKVLGDLLFVKFQEQQTYVKNSRGATGTRTILRLPRREATLMAMSYSYELQAKVYDAMETYRLGLEAVSTSGSHEEAVELADKALGLPTFTRLAKHHAGVKGYGRVKWKDDFWNACISKGCVAAAKEFLAQTNSKACPQLKEDDRAALLHEAAALLEQYQGRYFDEASKETFDNVEYARYPKAALLLSNRRGCVQARHITKLKVDAETVF